MLVSAEGYSTDGGGSCGLTNPPLIKHVGTEVSCMAMMKHGSWPARLCVTVREKRAVLSRVGSEWKVTQWGSRIASPCVPVSHTLLEWFHRFDRLHRRESWTNTSSAFRSIKRQKPPNTNIWRITSKAQGKDTGWFHFKWHTQKQVPGSGSAGLRYLIFRGLLILGEICADS